jgi:hypothetical protein
MAPHDPSPPGPGLTIVLGMHRSGTSLCSHVLSLLGLDMADEASPHESNPKGHWERWEIVQLHDRVFQLFGQDYYDPRHALPLPAGWWADPRVRRIRDEITQWLAARMQTSRRFGVKDPRISRLLPMWREILFDLGVEARFVACLRHPDSVAHSLDARDALDVAEGQFRWLTYTADLINGLGDTPVTVLPYDRWFSDFDANLVALAGLAHRANTGDPGLLSAIRGVVDPALRHHGEGRSTSGGPGADLYRLLLAAAKDGVIGQEARIVARSLDGFSRLVQPLREEVLRLRRAEADTQARLSEMTSVIDAQAREAASRTIQRQMDEMPSPTAGVALNGHAVSVPGREAAAGADGRSARSRAWRNRETPP